jgi:hypothetical protein
MRSTRRLILAVLIVTIAIGLVACGGSSSDESSRTTSTSAETTPTTTPTTTTLQAPTSPGCRTSIVPSVKRYCYTHGTAHADVTGAVTATVDTPIDPTKANALFPAPMDMLLAYAAGNGTSMLVLGNTITGTFPSTLPWAIRIVTAPDQPWNAGEGECDITVTTASPQKIEGSFTCKKVPNPAGTATVNATGTFLATP